MLVPIAGVVAGHGQVALADTGNSAAAQLCPQHAGLVHYAGAGSHRALYFDNHGACVSFFANNPQLTITG
jgi:hypothetical protein